MFIGQIFSRIFLQSLFFYSSALHPWLDWGLTCVTTNLVPSSLAADDDGDDDGIDGDALGSGLDEAPAL